MYKVTSFETICIYFEMCLINEFLDNSIYCIVVTRDSMTTQIMPYERWKKNVKPLKNLHWKPLRPLLNAQHQTLKSVRCCYPLRWFFFQLCSSHDDLVLSRRDKSESQKKRCQTNDVEKEKGKENRFWIVRGFECHPNEFCGCALGPSNCRFV